MKAGVQYSTQEIARGILGLLGTGRQIEPISARYPDFGLPGAYEVVSVVAGLRRERGEHPVGRKIGFTNRSVWRGYGISGPIWNFVFDSTVRDLGQLGATASLKGLPEPRIEPEIIFHLRRAPEPEMTKTDLFECIDWVAHGFEIAFSIFPQWNFTAADAAAAFGMHGALLLGERHQVDGQHGLWMDALASFTVELVDGDGKQVHGHSGNVLGGPLNALQFLVEELARFPNCQPLGAGELVTTGTLTKAMPARPGEVWASTLRGIDLRGLQVALA